MRHRKSNRRFDRPFNQRKALFRGLANDLLLHGRITTTLAKARAIRPRVEKLITLGREDTTHRRRLAFARLGGKTQLIPSKHQGKKKRVERRNVVSLLFDEIGPKYRGRSGGYTRILKVGARHGDSAEMAIIELV
jgi:large subunit ribosomal protein L17